MLQVGFELETVGFSCGYVEQALRGIVNIYPGCTYHHLGRNQYWAFSQDSSLHNDLNCEIKSPIDPPTEDIVLVCMALKELGCQINKYCALHIHVSDTEASTNNELRCRIPTLRAWASRKAYVKERALGRDNIHRIDYNHLEIRAFNASLNPRYILKMIEMVKKRCYRVEIPYGISPYHQDVRQNPAKVKLI